MIATWFKFIKTITLLHCPPAEEATTVTEFLLSHRALDLPLAQDRQAEHFQKVLIQFQVKVTYLRIVLIQLDSH